MPPHGPSQECSWLRSPGGLILFAFLAEVLAEFGEVYARYAAATPAFFPCLGRAVRHT